MTLLVTLVAVILATRILGEAAQRIGQPAVLGELLAGVLLGAGVIGVLRPDEPAFHAFAELGVLILLFEIGLHTDFRSLRRASGTATAVAGAGMVLPFAGGVLAARLLGFGWIPAIVAGAALTATSIGISSRLLHDLGRLGSAEGEVVLGAAIIDDVVALVLLSVVSRVVADGPLSGLHVATTSAVAVGFLVAALVLGSLVIPRLFAWIERIGGAGAMGLVALAFALAVALGAERSGSAAIIGAFVAGLVLHPARQRAEIEKTIAPLGAFFVPMFFASVGAAVELHSLFASRTLVAGAVLSAVAIGGKIVAGYAPWWFRGNKLLIGTAMVPRGEVGLLFAQMGLASAAISPELFGALMLMVLATTVFAPLMLARVAGPPPVAVGGGAPEIAVDTLIAGPRRTPRSTVAVGRRNKDG